MFKLLAMVPFYNYEACRQRLKVQSAQFDNICALVFPYTVLKVR